MVKIVDQVKRQGVNNAQNFFFFLQEKKFTNIVKEQKLNKPRFLHPCGFAGHTLCHQIRKLGTVSTG